MSQPIKGEWPTPDNLLHTGGERPVDPEDLVMARGQDVTPERLKKAQQELEEFGAAAIERVLP